MHVHLEVQEGYRRLFCVSGGGGGEQWVCEGAGGTSIPCHAFTNF